MCVCAHMCVCVCVCVGLNDQPVPLQLQETEVYREDLAFALAEGPLPRGRGGVGGHPLGRGV
jgi:hypothetical protein